MWYCLIPEKSLDLYCQRLCSSSLTLASRMPRYRPSFSVGKKREMYEHPVFCLASQVMDLTIREYLPHFPCQCVLVFFSYSQCARQPSPVIAALLWYLTSFGLAVCCFWYVNSTWYHRLSFKWLTTLPSCELAVYLLCVRLRLECIFTFACVEIFWSV